MFVILKNPHKGGMMKVLLNIKFNVYESQIKYHHDSPAMGAYVTEAILDNTYGPFDTRQEANRKLNSLKRKWSKKGLRKSIQSRPEDGWHELYFYNAKDRIVSGFESVILSIAEFEASREIIN